MCENLRSITELNVTVFKMVAKRPKGRKYFSIAMGFKYPQKGKVPKIKVQHCLGHFDRNILNPLSASYRSKMVGRTAGFVTRRSAEMEKSEYANISGYQVLIVKAKLTDDLMAGSYGGYPIIAGKHIEFLE